MAATNGQALFLGVPLKFVSLFTLTMQNSALTVLLHYSRKDVAPSKMYSAASAVLLNELLKGSISLAIAFRNAVHAQPSYAAIAVEEGAYEEKRRVGQGEPQEKWTDVWQVGRMRRGVNKLRSDIFGRDCWKLSIPACLYVIQNNLQFVAASNLSPPVFQVSYNLKILTTALVSVLLLKRRLSRTKWLALFFLAAGVGIVQLQSSTGAGTKQDHEMDQFAGMLAVACGCMTSGLAGVYFEMVLKGSKVDLWTRNCQLSFFSMLPALAPILLPNFSLFPTSTPHAPPPPAQAIFANFGFWAWAVVLTQVLGGLITALVIKYSDNILKGFATSLAIILSFCTGVVLFNFQVTTSFLVGTTVVVGATYLYNLPDARPSHVLHDYPLPVPSNLARPPAYAAHRHDYDPDTQQPLSALRSGNFAPPMHRRAHIMGSSTPDINIGFGSQEETFDFTSDGFAEANLFKGAEGKEAPRSPMMRSVTPKMGTP